MLKLSQSNKIREISEKNTSSTYKEDPKSIRPDVVDAKVYKLKSAFIKNSVFVTMSYIKHEEQIRPIEIFINSKDLTRAPEYVVLTRLISAIFRRSPNPLFILEELALFNISSLSKFNSFNISVRFGSVAGSFPS